MSRRALMLVAFLALAVRVGYLAEIEGTPVRDVLLIDSETYDRFARLLLRGEFRGENVYAVNVLYPVYLAGVYLLSGGSTLAALAVQVALDVLNVCLIAAIAYRLFDRRVAILAGIGAAFYAPFVFYAGALLTPTLINTLGLATIWALLRWAGQRARGVWLIVAGVTLGLASLGRGSCLLFLPLALLVLRLWTESWRRALRPCVALAASALLVVGVVIVRNALVEGRFVPIAANYAAFYIGHNAGATGLYALPELTRGASFEDEVEGTREAVSEIVGHPVTLAESAQWLFGRGLSFLVRHPGAEVRLAVKKLFYFWNRIESPTNLNFYFAEDHSRLLRWLPLDFGIVAPLAILGIVLRRRQWRAHAVLYAWGAVHLVTGLVFFVSAEYRLPIVPVLLPFAASAVLSLVSWLRASLPGSRAPAGKQARVALGGSALLLAVIAGPTHARDHLLAAQTLKRVDYLNVGTIYLGRGDLERAEKMFRRSLVIDPNFGPAFASLAEVAHRRGNEIEAVRLQQEARRRPARGQYRDAAPVGAAEEILFQASDAYGRGEYETALAAFRRLEELHRSAGAIDLAIRAANNVGLCQYKLGRLEEAEATLRDVVRSDTTYVYGYTNLARVLAARGDRVGADACYRKALDLEPANSRVVRGYQAFRDSRPGAGVVD